MVLIAPPAGSYELSVNQNSIENKSQNTTYSQQAFPLFIKREVANAYEANRHSSGWTFDFYFGDQPRICRCSFAADLPQLPANPVSGRTWRRLDNGSAMKTERA